MGVKKQHFVPKVYLKNWETKVTSKNEPNKYFKGVFHYEKNNLETGDGRNKDSILWEPRLYNINYELSIIIPSCPKIEEDYIKQVEYKLRMRNVVPYYNNRIIKNKEDLKKYFFKIDEWEFQSIDLPMKSIKKKAILNDLKSTQSYVLEHALDDVVEKKWQERLDNFINEVKRTAKLNGMNEIIHLDESIVIDVIKMIIFLMCRNPKFDYLGVLPRVLDIFRNSLYEIAGSDNIEDVEIFIKSQGDAVWLKQLYNAVFDVEKGYFHTIKTAAQNSMQMILFKTCEDQGSFITSDNPAFINISSVEAENYNSIICPLTTEYLVMIVKGDKHSLRDVSFRIANNYEVKTFNRLILNHSNESIVSNYKHLGYIL